MFLDQGMSSGNTKVLKCLTGISHIMTIKTQDNKILIKTYVSSFSTKKKNDILKIINRATHCQTD